MKKRIGTGLSIKVTTRCNLACKGCFAQSWMDSATYDMSIPQMVHLIEETIESEYVYDFITISGGEPTLWPHLKRGLRLLHTSGIADKIIIFSNGLKLEKIYDEIEQYVYMFKVSNHKKREDLLDRIKEWPKVRYIEKDFLERPVYSEDAFPVECTLPSYSYFNGRVSVCCNCEAVLHDIGRGDEIVKYSVPVSKNYISKLKRKNPMGWDFCAYCTMNKNTKREFIK